MELKDSIERAHAVFERIELPDYEDGYQEILMLDGDTGQLDTTHAIVDLTRQLQERILSEHLVTLTEDSALDARTSFIEGLLLLPDYEDHDAILRTLAQDINDEEILAELMALVTEHNADEWLVVIQSVSASLLDKLRALHSPEASNPEGSELRDAEMRAARINAMLALAKICQVESFAVMRLINNGADIGYPFIVYASQIGHELEGVQAKSVAGELMAMALASADGFETPVPTIKEQLDHLVTDPDEITKILVHINDMALQLQNAQLLGIKKVTE